MSSFNPPSERLFFIHVDIIDAFSLIQGLCPYYFGSLHKVAKSDIHSRCNLQDNSQ
uniref:Uncharacterized protein n=1 Tax=Lepeophtheirus salmonis TaxID=72036 RepID=A0A0K2VHK8_LEPSM